MSAVQIEIGCQLIRSAASWGRAAPFDANAPPPTLGEPTMFRVAHALEDAAGGAA